jgi:hypothetical protein
MNSNPQNASITPNTLVTFQGFQGTARYIGPTEFAAGEWCGIELSKPIGKNDGTVNGVQYFTCKPNHGVFVRLSNVSAVECAEEKSDRTPARPVRPTPRRVSGGEERPKLSSLAEARRKSVVPRSVVQTPAKPVPFVVPSFSSEGSVDAKPATVSKSESVVSKSDATASIPETTASKPDTTASKPDTTARNANTTLSKSEPTTSPKAIIPKQEPPPPIQEADPPSKSPTTFDFTTPMKPPPKPPNFTFNLTSGLESPSLRVLPELASETYTPATPRTRPSTEPFKTPGTTMREMTQLYAKIRTLEKLRSEDVEKLKRYEALVEEVFALRSSLSASEVLQGSLRGVVGGLKVDLKRMEGELMRFGEEKEELVKERELFLLDRDLSEERCKVMQLELDYYRHLAEEVSSSHTTTTEDHHVTQLKQALMKLRDQKSHQEQDFTRRIQSLELELTKRSDLQAKNEVLSRLVERLELEKTEMEESLTFFSASSTRIKTLEEAQRRLLDEVKFLSERVVELESLRDVHEDVELLFLENERVLLDTVDEREQHVSALESEVIHLKSLVEVVEEKKDHQEVLSLRHKLQKMDATLKTRDRQIRINRLESAQLCDQVSFLKEVTGQVKEWKSLELMWSFIRIAGKFELVEKRLCLLLSKAFRVLGEWMRVSPTDMFLSVGEDVSVVWVEDFVDSVLNRDEEMGTDEFFKVDEFSYKLLRSFCTTRVGKSLVLYLLDRISYFSPETRVGKVKKFVKGWTGSPREVDWMFQVVELAQSGVDVSEHLDCLFSLTLENVTYSQPWSLERPTSDALVNVSAELSLLKMELRRREEEMSEVVLMNEVLQQRSKLSRMPQVEALERQVEELRGQLESKPERVMENICESPVFYQEAKRLRRLLYDFGNVLPPLVLKVQSRGLVDEVRKMLYEYRLEAAGVVVGGSVLKSYEVKRMNLEQKLSQLF